MYNVWRKVLRSFVGHLFFFFFRSILTVEIWPSSVTPEFSATRFTLTKWLTHNVRHDDNLLCLFFALLKFIEDSHSKSKFENDLIVYKFTNSPKVLFWFGLVDRKMSEMALKSSSENSNIWLTQPISSHANLLSHGSALLSSWELNSKERVLSQKLSQSIRQPTQL